MDKKIKITYTVCGMDFTAEASTVSEAYEYLKAIITKETDKFPDKEDTLSKYMENLVDMKNGKTIRFCQNVILVEAAEEATQNE